MEETLIAILLADTALKSLVGSRIRPVERPQTDALPGVTIQRIDGVRDYHFSGPSGFVSSRIQIDCWGKSYSEAKQISRAIVRILSGIRAPFQGGFVVDESDNSEQADTHRVFRTRLDFQLFHNEAL